MEFDQIYSTYFKSVYLYVMQLSGNEHIAEEITSETFFKAIHKGRKRRRIRFAFPLCNPYRQLWRCGI